MLVALMLHSEGNSTPRCSKLIEPSRQLVMTTSRRSQVTSSYGCTPAVVKTRLIFRPFPLVVALAARRVRPDKRSSVSVTSSPSMCGPAAGEEPQSGAADGCVAVGTDSSQVPEGTSAADEARPPRSEEHTSE